MTTDPIKCGDVATRAWTLAPVPTGATSARLIIAQRPGKVPVIDRAISLSGDKATATATFTAAETDVTPGIYCLEVETLPGPATYPSAGYEYIEFVADLDPPTP